MLVLVLWTIHRRDQRNQPPEMSKRNDILTINTHSVVQQVQMHLVIRAQIGEESIGMILQSKLGKQALGSISRTKKLLQMTDHYGNVPGEKVNDLNWQIPIMTLSTQIAETKRQTLFPMSKKQ